MELELSRVDITVIDRYVTEKLSRLSDLDIDVLQNDLTKLERLIRVDLDMDAWRNDSIKLEKFIREHIYSDILLNNLTQLIITESQFYERKAFLIRVETFLFK